MSVCQTQTCQMTARCMRYQQVERREPDDFGCEHFLPVSHGMIKHDTKAGITWFGVMPIPDTVLDRMIAKRDEARREAAHRGYGVTL